MIQNGIIETATGDLLRCGFKVFTPGTGETYRTDVPHPGYCKYKPELTYMHRWNGSAWVEVAQPEPPPKPAVFDAVQTEQVDTTPSGQIRTGKVNSDMDVEIDSIGKGPVLKSPDGNRWRIKVSNSGVLSTEGVD